jgi:hypothetical protein
MDNAQEWLAEQQALYARIDKLNKEAEEQEAAKPKNTESTNFEPRIFIVTKAHNLDYVSAEAMLVMGVDMKETFIRVIISEHERWFDAIPDPQDYDNGTASRSYQYDMEAYEEFVTELANLRAMSMDEIEQHDRDNGNVWDIDEFEMPDLSDGSIVQICKLDSD